MDGVCVTVLQDAAMVLHTRLKEIWFPTDCGGSLICPPLIAIAVGKASLRYATFLLFMSKISAFVAVLRKPKSKWRFGLLFCHISIYPIFLAAWNFCTVINRYTGLSFSSYCVIDLILKSACWWANASISPYIFWLEYFYCDWWSWIQWIKTCCKLCSILPAVL